MAGANLKAANRRFRLRQLFFRFLSATGTPTAGLPGRMGRFRRSKNRSLVAKNGAPVNNAAGDNPGKLSMICVDTLNKDVYLSTAYVSPTSHTWTKISQ